MGKPTKARSKKAGAAREAAEQPDVANGEAQQPATTPTPAQQQDGAQGASERPIRVYADGACGITGCQRPTVPQTGWQHMC